MATYRQMAAEEALAKLKALSEFMHMSNIDIDRVGQIRFGELEHKNDNTNVSRKSNKKRIKSANTNISNIPNLDKLFEEYLKKNPDILNKYINNYIANNLKIDYVRKDNGRYKIGLYLGNKLISESTLGLTLY